MEILAGELPKIFALGSRWLPYLRNLRSNISYLSTLVGAAVYIQGLRALGAFHDLSTPIVTGTSTPSEYPLFESFGGTGTKRVTPCGRSIAVGLPPTLSKAVSVLDSHDGPSGAKVSGNDVLFRDRTRVS